MNENEVISVIVAALAAGATAGLQDTVSQSVKEAYAGLKGLIQRKSTDVRFGELEREPNSEVSRDAVKTDLINAGALKDEEFRSKARALMDAIRTSAPEVADNVGLKLEDFHSASLSVSNIKSEGIGTWVKGARIQGPADFSGIIQASHGTSNPKA